MSRQSFLADNDRVVFLADNDRVVLPHARAFV